MSPDDRREPGCETIGGLIAEAGPRPEMPRDRLESVRTAARASWRAALDGRAAAGDPAAGPAAEATVREARRHRWLLAASILMLAFLAGWWISRRDDAERADVGVTAAVVEVAAEAVVEPPTGRPRPLLAGDRVAEGERVEVAAGTGRLSLRIAGGSLRIATGSIVEVVSSHQVRLGRGALYFDSGASAAATPRAEPEREAPNAAAPGGGTMPGASSFAVRTAWGVVEEVGTQFEVRVPEGDGGGPLRVRVREGEVRVRGPGLEEAAAGGTELVVGAGGEIQRRTIATTGDEWSWAIAAAPPFEREGRTLGAYLDWVARETGWTIRFAETDLAELRASVMHGPPVPRPDRYRETLAINGLAGELLGAELILREVESR